MCSARVPNSSPTQSGWVWKASSRSGGTRPTGQAATHRVAAEQDELLPEREVLEREVGVGPEIETAMGRRVRRSFVATKRQQSNGRADPPSELPTEGIGCWSMGRACIEALLSPVSNGIE